MAIRESIAARRYWVPLMIVVNAKTARIDSFLWAVRVYKTRSASKAGVVGGHVVVNGAKVKPAHRVKVGDRIEARVGPRLRIVEVVEPIEKRVGAERAWACLIDHSPPPPKAEHTAVADERDRGSGRPTKRDRRAINRLKGR
jgi:ribosome-associated heat shock protein Hsp15